MKRNLLILLVWLCLAAHVTVAQTTVFTYQGKLTDEGNPASGNYDLQFKLFDTMVRGTGTQQDAWANQNRLPVEERKPEVERGSYQNPAAFGQPEEKGMEWTRGPEQMRQLKEQRAHPQPERTPQSAALPRQN